LYFSDGNKSSVPPDLSNASLQTAIFDEGFNVFGCTIGVNRYNELPSLGQSAYEGTVTSGWLSGYHDIVYFYSSNIKIEVFYDWDTKILFNMQITKVSDLPNEYINNPN